jgi:phage repressor protein C with HTH and peptisase S24 domain
MIARQSGAVLNHAMSTIGQRIRDARKAAGLTQEQLALAIGGAGQSTIGNYERGDSDPSIEALRNIASVTGRSIAWLMEETDHGGGHHAENSRAPYQLPENKYALIRRYQVTAGAGEAHANGHEEISGAHAYRRDWLEKRGLVAAACVVIDVKGESMEPTICDGDTVLINTIEKKLKNNNIYAFRTDEGVRLKRLHRQLDGRVKVSSDNANKIAFPDEWLTPDSEAEIIGLVVHRAGGV